MVGGAEMETGPALPNLTSSKPTASVGPPLPAIYARLEIEEPESMNPKKRVPPDLSPAGMLSTSVAPFEYPMLIVCPLSCQPVKYAPNESIGSAKVKVPHCCDTHYLGLWHSSVERGWNTHLYQPP